MPNYTSVDNLTFSNQTNYTNVTAKNRKTV